MTAPIITPRAGDGVCPRCFNFTREPAGLCRACAVGGDRLEAMLPISYAAAGGQLHRDLADYKRTAEPAVPFLIRQLTNLLARFLGEHETCLARSAGVEHFELVCVVPSSDPRRDAHHPFRRIVAEALGPGQDRFCDILSASGRRCVPHAYDAGRFRCADSLHGESVLLIDDVWTTGACAQSAAAVLKACGAGPIAAVVIGRYVNGFWGGIAERLVALQEARPADGCSFCAGSTASSTRGGKPTVAVDFPPEVLALGEYG